MIKFGNNDTKLYLGANEVSSIYLGSTQVYDGGDTPTPPTPTPTPSTDVPLDNSFAVKVNGVWNESQEYITEYSEIEMYLDNDFGLQPSDIEELVIGNNTSNINLDGENWTNCTGLTLAPNVQTTDDIHNFPAMEWVNVMPSNFDYYGMSGLFSDMNCCPVYVPEESLSYYQSRWSSETTSDCQGSVADRLIGWNNPDEWGTGE